MRRTRRTFSREYRFEAAHRVIDEKRRVVDVARELDVHKSLLQTWVRDERWRMAEAAARSRPDSSGGQSLSLDERAELTRLRAQVVEQAEAIALLEKAAVYFSAQRNRPEFHADFGSSEKCHDVEQERQQHQDQGTAARPPASR